MKNESGVRPRRLGRLGGFAVSVAIHLLLLCVLAVLREAWDGLRSQRAPLASLRAIARLCGAPLAAAHHRENGQQVGQSLPGGGGEGERASEID